jgi:hypothetical protein
VAKAKQKARKDEIYWEGDIESPGDILLCHTKDFRNVLGTVWRQNNGKWAFQVLYPHFFSSPKGYVGITTAMAALVEEVKKQYRDIAIALQKVTIGPTTKS